MLDLVIVIPPVRTFGLTRLGSLGIFSSRKTRFLPMQSTLLIAGVWIFHGLYSKILNGIPRHYPKEENGNLAKTLEVL